MRPIEQVGIRFAEELDAAAIQAIYAPYCESSAVSFETKAPSVEEIVQRIHKISGQFPWIVGERDRRVIGYAYGSRHSERAAYQWSVDATVYVSPSAQRTGLGRALYTSLFRILALQGYYKAYAGITLPNSASVGLHEAMGFKPVGVYRGVGYKLGRWHDVGWWELSLRPESDEPPAPRSIQEIRCSRAVEEALEAGKKLLVRSGS
jgi:L-amino acid N-acyltransferase YncA